MEIFYEFADGDWGVTLVNEGQVTRLSDLVALDIERFNDFGPTLTPQQIAKIEVCAEQCYRLNRGDATKDQVKDYLMLCGITEYSTGRIIGGVDWPHY